MANIRPTGYAERTSFGRELHVAGHDRAHRDYIKNRPDTRMTSTPASAPEVSIGHKAVTGVFWNVAAGGTARLASLIGTLLLTYYIKPDIAGDISAASLAV